MWDRGQLNITLQWVSEQYNGPALFVRKSTKFMKQKIISNFLGWNNFAKKTLKKSSSQITRDCVDRVIILKKELQRVQSVLIMFSASLNNS